MALILSKGVSTERNTTPAATIEPVSGSIAATKSKISLIEANRSSSTSHRPNFAPSEVATFLSGKIKGVPIEFLTAVSGKSLKFTA